MVEEPFDEGKLVGVDGLVGAGYIVRVPHRVRKAVYAQHQWRAAREGEFAVEQGEDGPSDFGVLGAEEGEAGEGDVGGNGDWQVVLGRLAGQLQGFQNGICAGHGAEEGGGVSALGVEGWFGGGEGAIFGCGEDEVLGCKKGQKGVWKEEST